MITGVQVRAARAILDWGGDKLAEKTGLHRDTIHKIENGKVAIRGKSAEKITQAFIDEGVEFIGDRGVAKTNENYRIIEGSDCYLLLLDEIYHALRKKPGTEVLSICTDDSVSPTEVVTAIRRWHEAKIKCRFLSHEAATRFDFPLEEYRLISSKYFKNSVMVVYDDKVATLRRSDDDLAEEDSNLNEHEKEEQSKSGNESVLIINDRDQAEMLRGLFELIWDQASKPAIAVKGTETKSSEIKKPQSKLKK